MRNALLILATAQLVSATAAWAGCDVIGADKSKSAFDGGSLAGVQVEKKSLIALNKAFPALNVVEKSFKGEVVTCTNCTEKHISCSE